MRRYVAQLRALLVKPHTLPNGAGLADVSLNAAALDVIATLDGLYVSDALGVLDRVRILLCTTHVVSMPEVYVQVSEAVRRADDDRRTAGVQDQE